MSFIAKEPDLENGSAGHPGRLGSKYLVVLLSFSMILFFILSSCPLPAFQLIFSPCVEKAVDLPERRPSEIRFNVGEHRFLGRPVGRALPIFMNKIDTLATVVPVLPNEIVNASFIDEKRREYLDRDDVFRPEFLAAIILHGLEESEVEIRLNDTSELPEEWQTAWIERHFPGSNDPTELLRPGPYKIIAGTPYQAYGLHEDTNKAFVQSTLPTADNSHNLAKLEALGDADYTLAVAVESRLSSFPSGYLPLNGIRLAVKDAFNIRGLHTTLNSRAFHELDSIHNETASAVAWLQAAGAQIMGKTQMSAFALEEDPTQNVDSTSAFNPRGDGYQIPGGSSSGSAAAVASYEWVDVALGTDTTGSMRIPALLNGVFSLRTSSNSVPTDGIVKIYEEFDTPGLFARDLQTLQAVASVWLPEQPSPSPRTVEVMIIDDFLNTINSDQVQIFEDFVFDLANHTQVQRISIVERWASSGLVEETNLHTYFHNATAHGFYYAAYHSFDSFRSSYEQRFEKDPFITELVRWIWQEGSYVTIDEHVEMNHRIEVFRAWFLQQFLPAGKSNVILALPIDNVAPFYRDEWEAVPSEPIHGLRNTYLSPMIGAPELAIPIAEIPYLSRITGNQEFLPVVVSLMGAPHTDMQLISNTLHMLNRAKRPTQVLTGYRTFGVPT